MTNRPANDVSVLLKRLAILVGATDIPVVDDKGIAPGLDMLSDAQRLNSYSNAIQSGVTEILVVGMFNSGKSTLVNALIGIEGTPMGPTPTTAVITRLVSGNNLQVTVYPRHGSSKQITWEEYANTYTIESIETSESEAVSKHDTIHHIEVAYPFPLLHPGDAIVDTPGIGEHHARASLVLEHLPRAHALILVIDAAQPMTRTEQDFIRLFGQGRMENLFIVINRADLLRKHEDQIRVREKVASAVAPFFVNADGKGFDDELFAQRFFVTNALAALEARLAQPMDVGAYKASGVEALETEVNTFLARGDDRYKGALRALLPTLADTLHRAKETASRRIELLSQESDVIRSRAESAVSRLQEWNRATDAIRAVIVSAGDIIKFRIYDDLVTFTNGLVDSWEHDVTQLDLEALTNTNILEGKLSDSERQRFTETLGSELERYLEMKFILWARRLPQVLHPYTTRLVDDLKYQLRAYNAELSDLTAQLGVQSAVYTTNDLNIAKRGNLSDLITPDIIAGLTPSLIDQLSYSLKKANALQDIALTVLRVTLEFSAVILGGVGKLAIAILSRVGGELLGQLQRRRESERYRSKSEDGAIDIAYKDLGRENVEKLQVLVYAMLVDKLADPLFQRISKTVRENKEVILQQIKDEFDQIATIATQSLSDHSQATILAVERLRQLREHHRFSLDSEKRRLEAVLSEVEALTNQLTIHAIGRELTLDEILEAAALHTQFIERYASVPGEPEVSDETDADEWAASSASLEDVVLDAKTISNHISQVVGTMFGMPEHIQDTESDAELEMLAPRLAKMVGLQSVKQHILDLMANQKEIIRRRENGYQDEEQQSLHLIFYGNPGTGKTTVAEEVGAFYKRMGLLKRGHVVTLSREDLVGEYIGHTEPKIRKAFEDARDGVLFIDEAHTLYIGKGGEKDFGHQVIGVLNRQMELRKAYLAVVLAGYRRGIEELLKSDDGLKRRFPEDNRIEFPDYTPNELIQILMDFLIRNRYSLSTEAKDEVERVIIGMYEKRDQSFGNAGAMRNLAESLRKLRNARVTRKHLDINEPIRPEDIPPHYLKYRETRPTRKEAARPDTKHERRHLPINPPALNDHQDTILVPPISVKAPSFVQPAAVPSYVSPASDRFF